MVTANLNETKLPTKEVGTPAVSTMTLTGYRQGLEVHNIYTAVTCSAGKSYPTIHSSPTSLTRDNLGMSLACVRYHQICGVVCDDIVRVTTLTAAIIMMAVMMVMIMWGGQFQ